MRRSRRGVALVLLLISCIALMAFLALAIDIGFLALAQTQVCDVADAAAMAAARSLNGDTANNNNYDAAVPAAQTVTASNYVLGRQLTTADVATRIGCYTYDTNHQRFEGVLDTKPGTDNWNLAQATVTADVTGKTILAKMLHFVAPTTMTATATAAHRPRDIAMVLDYSGSMRFGSFMALKYGGLRLRGNNLDPAYPQFGVYASANDIGSPYSQSIAPWLILGFSTTTQLGNITTTTPDGRPPIIKDFYTDAAGTPAFTDAGPGYVTTPGGDCPLHSDKNDPSSAYATTVADINSNGNPPTAYWNGFEQHGYEFGSLYSGQAPTWKGYTQGPGYYGKTFFIWPPNPIGSDGVTPTDWRKLYFTYPDGVTPMNDNTRLFYTTATVDYTSYPPGVGSLQPPTPNNNGTTTYKINYDKILKWIKSDPCPFPSQLVSGRIVYYTAIPDTIDTSVYPPADLNQRFWRDYIDYVLGFSEGWEVGTYVDLQCLTGYGIDFTSGAVQIKPPPPPDPTGAASCYMDYKDNPKRPILRFWFGPLTMLDFIGNYNIEGSPGNLYTWMPGTCHEYPLYPCKLGIRAALSDIKNNHPNDMVSVIMFSHPISPRNIEPDSGNDSPINNGRFNCARSPLSRNYNNMIDSLFYPQSTIINPGTTVTPYDINNLEEPRSDGCTCYAMALMLAYNQFSSNATLRTYTEDNSGLVGGNGRKGAQKIIIFETDGAPNTPTNDISLQNQSPNNAYYPIRYNPASPQTSEFPTWISCNSPLPATTPQIYTLCQQLAAQESEFGYSTPSRPLLIHCIAFGPQGVDPTALDVMNQMQKYGNVNDSMPAYKQVNSADSGTIIAKLQQAIQTILQDGVQVSLIQ